MLFHTFYPIKDMRLVLPALIPASILGSDWGLSLKKIYSIPAIILALLFSSYAAYVIVSGNYYWYLDFWHYKDWYIYFFNNFLRHDYCILS